MTPTPKTRAPLFGGDPFEQLVAIVMTLVLIQTAVITFWFTLADDSNGDAGRDSQMFALQGLGKRTVGTMQSSYDETNAFQRWLELDTVARLAEQRNDAASAKHFRAARERILKLSPLLNAPYFDPTQDKLPDFAAYQVDTFLVEAVALAERFENQARLKTQWSDRAGAYTVMLTMLAVTLFLLGISTNRPRRMRILFFGIGVALALSVLVWMLATFTQPVAAYSDEAINAYARGVGEEYKSDSQKALAEFDRAIQLAPTYVNAYRQRGITKYYANDVAGAAADFEQTRANGDMSSETTSGLAFTYYRLGKFEQAKALHANAVENKADEMWIRANAALNLLAIGEMDATRSAYDTLLNLAVKLVSDARAQGKEPSAALWFEFDESANDLDALAACASQQECKDAPPFSSLTHPAQIASAAEGISTKLKEYSVALEYTSKPPPETIDAQVEPFLFTREFSDDDEPINESDTFTATDEPVYVSIPFRNLRDGQKIVIKVYVDGAEDERLRVVDDYSSAEMGGADGDVFLAITTGGVPLSEGAYHVEMYVEGRLVQTGDFRVVM